MTERRTSVALVAGAVTAGLALGLVLAVHEAAGVFIASIPSAVGLAVLLVAVRAPAFKRPVVAAVLAAGVTAVLLYLALFALAISAIPEDFQEAM